MHKLSLIILLVLVFPLISVRLMADSPHGKDFKLNCDLCHSSKGWTFDKSVYAFDHNKTLMPLTGQHQVIDCRQCHKSLVFSEAKTTCIDCHTDMHNQTVGPDCGRCHTSKSWIVENITEMHQRSRFPLTGPHYTTDCSRCHPSASQLRFEPQGVECYDCHSANYLATTKPNHVQGGYSKNCQECHSMNSITWTSTNIKHDFFPLTNGHAIGDCSQCHVNGTYSNLSKECVSCHQVNYNATTNPNHITASFPTSCSDCHTTVAGWKPATYTSHDAQFFPVYSGKHAGTWNACSDCHTTPGSLKSFSCIDCHDHNQPAMDSKHNGVGGYTFASLPCYECHPTGSVQGAFNHNSGKFPLTGAHITTPCGQCHTSGFQGTPTDCLACHQANYNATTNPNHQAANIPTTCGTCHTTNPGWKPATYMQHDAQYFPVYSGKHAGTWTTCAECHTTSGSYKSFSCIDCHAHNQADMDSKHNGVGGYTYASLPCYECHPTGSVQGSFNHNNGSFPLTGVHITTPCGSCHSNGFAGTPTDCFACHQTNFNATTNPNHTAKNIPNTCATCHTTAAGWKPAAFPTHSSYYPLTGAHASIANNCVQCHNGNYINPPNTCVGCHQANYNSTTNPNHASAGFPTDCASCHSQTAWTPSTFNHDPQYFPIYSGHHKNRWNLCSDCHPTASNFLTFTCTTSCHSQNTTDNHHQGVSGYQYNSNACYNCHPTGSSGGKLIKIPGDFMRKE